MQGNAPETDVQSIYQKVKDLLVHARARAFQAVNTEMVVCYWNIGRLIVEGEQRGEKRAEYGQFLITELSKRLTKEFGKGFSLSNVKYFRQFYLSFTIGHAVRDQLKNESDAPGQTSLPDEKSHAVRDDLPVIQQELSWTHYRLLLKVENPDARAFYMTETVNARWSTRELERQINSLLFERLALSRDKKGVMKLAAKGHEIQHITDLIKDPYVLEFAGLKQEEMFLEKDLESRTLQTLVGQGRL